MLAVASKQHLSCHLLCNSSMNEFKALLLLRIEKCMDVDLQRVLQSFCCVGVVAFDLSSLQSVRTSVSQNINLSQHQSVNEKQWRVGMNTAKSGFLRTLVAVFVLSSLLLSCAAPAAAPGESAASAPAAAAPAGTVARKDILVLPGNVNIPAPDIWNPYIPGTFILQGMNQNMMEPLFMLSYETGKIEGWLAESYEANATLDEWIIKLRPGTEWSDGKPLTSEDVVFTINLLKDNAPQLNWSGAVQQWVKSVEAVDDRTVKFVLTGSNPRFVMENLAGTTSQAIVPLPKHVWEGKDPVRRSIHC